MFEYIFEPGGKFLLKLFDKDSQRVTNFDSS